MNLRALLLLLPPLFLLAGCEVPTDLVDPALSPGHGKGVYQVCVLLKEGEDPLELAFDYSLILVENFGNGRLLLLQGSVDMETLQSDSRVESAQWDAFSVLSHPVDVTMGFFEGDWESLEFGFGDGLQTLGLNSVHEHLTGKGVRVAILDTGVDPDHPMLAKRLELIPPGSSVMESEERLDGIDADGDGLFDEAYGHGTHVAGIIRRVAPDARLIPIRVLNSDGAGSSFELAMGLYTAQSMGAQVVNLSLVLERESVVVETVIRELKNDGIVVVGAAGNTPGVAAYPAQDSDVLSIGALATPTLLASFSASYEVRVAAPGVDVLSAFPGGRVATASGTSMACAVASGAMAIVIQGGRTPLQAMDAIRHTARPLSCLDDGAIDLVGAARLGGLGDVDPHDVP